MKNRLGIIFPVFFTFFVVAFFIVLINVANGKVDEHIFTKVYNIIIHTGDNSSFAVISSVLSSIDTLKLTLQGFATSLEGSLFSFLIPFINFFGNVLVFITFVVNMLYSLLDFIIYLVLSLFPIFG